MDSAHQVIVAARATNQTSDKQQAAAMMEETIDNVGAVPREVSADAGYYSAKAVDGALCSGRGPVRRAGADPPRPGCATRAPRSHTQPSVSPGTGCDGSYRPGRVGSATLCGCKLWSRYSARSSRAGDSRQFLLRGLEKVNGEWSLICTGHNLLKLFRFGVSLHRKARVDGPAQRIRNFCRGSEHGAIRKAIWGLARGNRQN